MKRMAILIFFALLLEILSAQAPVEPASGNGTPDDPYHISTLENLYWVTARNEIVEEPDQAIRFASHYKQMADIDASETANWFNGQGWIPIGDTVTHFSGSYNGQGFVIDGLFINNPSGLYAGLWGYTEEATIENLGLTDIDYTAGSIIGGLTAYNSEGSVIYNCYTTGVISSSNIDSICGGLVGENTDSFLEASYSSVDIDGYLHLGGLIAIDTNSSILDCYFTGNVTGVTGSWYLGGLVGLQYYSTIEKSFSTGNINGTNGVGGLVGFRYYSSIFDSYATGQVSANYGSGGLVGIEVGSTMENCYSNATIDGHYYAGGLVGYLTNQPPSSRLEDIKKPPIRYHRPGIDNWQEVRYEYSINNCFNTGTVNGSYYVGGLTGTLSDKATLNNSFNNGPVEGTGHYTGGLVGGSYEYSLVSNSFNTGDIISTSDLWSWVGGIVGENHNSDITNSYSTGNVSGLECTGGLVGEQVNGVIENSYATGSVSSNTSLAGGLVGCGEGVDNNNYWNIETAGLSVSSMGEGRTTLEMTYPYAANTYMTWDFEEIWAADQDYMMNNGYPYLRSIEYPVSIEDGFNEINSPIALSNFPNPFNPQTTIRLYLPETEQLLELKIYNIRGQLIRELITAPTHPKGEFQVVWDGKDDNGKTVTSGVYFCRLVTPRQTKSRKMMLIK